MSNLSAALDYLRPIAASATVGKYPEHLATLIAAVERLQAERDEVCALRDENARLRADLDAGFAASDHLSAKYYQRMRDAERQAGVEVVKDSGKSLHLTPELDTRLAHLLYEDGTGEDKLDTSIYREQWVRKARLMLRKLAAGQEWESDEQTH